MKIYTYTLKVKHDKGIVNLTTSATDSTSAIRIVMAAERCPERSIISTRAYDVGGFQMNLWAPDEPRVFHIHSFNFKSDRYLKNPAKGTTRHKVRIGDQRWRRVYEAKRGEANIYYVIIEGLKVIVTSDNFGPDLDPFRTQSTTQPKE